MAVASVTTNIVIKGQDDASAAINKASQSAKGLTGSLQAVQSKAQGLTGSLRSMVSGDVLGGLNNLKGSLGGGPGLAGQAALAAAGIAGVGVALGAAAVKVTEWSIEIERLRAQMRFAFKGGEQEALAFAEAVGGVGVESVVKLQTTLKAAGVDGKVTVQQLQQIANAATAMGKTGDDALSAFADAIRSGSTEALKQVGVFVNSELALKSYALTLGMASAEGLTQAQKSQAVLNAVMREVPGIAQAGTDTYARQDAALATLSNSTKRFGLELSAVVAGPAIEIVESINRISAAMDRSAVSVNTALRVMSSPITAVLKSVNEALKAVASLATAADRVFAAIKTKDPRQIMGALSEAQNEVGNAAKHAADALVLGLPGIGAAVVSYEAVSGAMGKTAEKAKATATALEVQGGATTDFTVVMQQAAAAAGKFADAQVKVAAKTEAARKAAQAAAARAAAQAKARRALIASQDAEFMAGLAGPDTRGNDLARQEVEAVRSRAAAMEEYRDRVMGVHQELATDPAVAAQIEQTRIRLDLQRQIAEVSERYAMDEQLRQQAVAAVTIEANAKMAESAKRLAEVEAAAAARRTDQAFGVAAAVAQGLGMIEGAERAQAGVQALIETARSIQSFAMYDFAAGAQHALAAVAFAKAALTAPPATGAGAATSRQIQEPAQRAQSAGVTNIVLNGVYATKAQVGAALGAALGAAKPTGMLPA